MGTHNQGFERLVRKADELAKTLKEDVVIQKGCTQYKPINSKYYDFVRQDQFEEICRRARVIVTHGGIGSIITPLKFGKPVIVVPRLKKFREHTDDHQLQITKELEKQKRITAVYDIKNLKAALSETGKTKSAWSEKNNRIKELVKDFIDNL